MKKMMKQFGINIEELDDVQEVIIKTRSKDIVFKGPAVTIMTTQGEKTYQITGNPETVEKEGSETQADETADQPSIPADDVKLVMDQTGASEEDAKKALEECDGNPAEAIIKLMQDM
jgi:nascent polypeptide-associated complex subunit alpha